MDKNKLGKTLKEIRERNNMSQQEMADSLGTYSDGLMRSCSTLMLKSLLFRP